MVCLLVVLTFALGNIVLTQQPDHVQPEPDKSAVAYAHYTYDEDVGEVWKVRMKLTTSTFNAFNGGKCQNQLSCCR